MSEHRAALDTLTQASRRAVKPDLAADIWGLNRLGALPDDIQAELIEAGYACWCVAFSPREVVRDTPWWASLLQRDYRHCFAFRQLTPETVLMLNQVGTALNCQVCPLPLEAYLRATLESGRTVLVTVRPRPPMVPWLRAPMTCVETVKSLLGICTWRIITPRQLARKLCADGAVTLTL